MNTYTAFCQQASGKGTVWIDTVGAANQDEALEVARAGCAHDWNCEPDDIHVLGLAEGDINILMWDDIDE